MSGKLLLASIHDVGPRFEREVDQLAGLLAGILGGPKFAMLVVPDHWGEAPLAQNKAFQARLRDWADQGVEMFVHGWFHKDLAEHSGAAAFKARHMTAGEGEFLGLSREVAAQRMADGRKLIEDAIGREVAGFIAPAWLYGEGVRAALADSGFALAEDHMRVWRPSDGKVLAKGPVITWASRSVPRQLSSRFFAGLARHALHPQKVMRIAVHPGDTTVPALLHSIAQTYTAYARRRPAGRYADLLTP
ncbi:polysaccharide deacetylase family protein [Novosphingobium sp.]|uniref:polysaccharide deacetylase family protein n=1 Tax=Novosphingobium sp. TaxID=1874826 RepID=UPI0025E54D4C|nr:polysaccharide deacetylase family protein [Novosphingobium sp.]MCC6926562.1 polysaccharide deacetylase family protein [Novosphingobium sp.]